MDDFDYATPAELFSPVRAGVKRSPLEFRRFDASAEAIKYAIKSLPVQTLQYTILEVGDLRLDAASIRSLYDSSAYPLPRRPAA